MPVTVFVTAPNHYAIQAFEVQALDYLTKPVEPERLRATLQHVKERVASQAALITQEQFKSMLAALNDRAPARADYPKRLLVPNGTPNGSRDSFVNVEDIEWIEAADYYSCLHVGSKMPDAPRNHQTTRGNTRPENVRPRAPFRHRKHQSCARNPPRRPQRRLGSPLQRPPVKDEQSRLAESARRKPLIIFRPRLLCAKRVSRCTLPSFPCNSLDTRPPPQRNLSCNGV